MKLTKRPFFVFGLIILFGFPPPVFAEDKNIPWRLVWYGGFETENLAKNFELYLKTGSGKAFAYKRLLNTEALKKDFSD